MKVVSPSPHLHSGDSVRRLMRDVVIALTPALLFALWVYRFDALRTTAVAVLSCLLFEWFITRYMLRRENSIKDCSAALTGLLLAFNLPAEISPWLVVLGSLVAIGVAKMSFGGLGNNIFNPALVGRVFLLVSFPVQMTTYTVNGVTGATPLTALRETAANVANAASGATASGTTGATTGATQMVHDTAYMAQNTAQAVSDTAVSITHQAGQAAIDTAVHIAQNGAQAVAEVASNTLQSVSQYGEDFYQMFVGFGKGGSLGEIAGLLLLLGGVYLVVRKVITWHIPVAVLGTMALFAAVAWWIDPSQYATPLFHLFAGGAILGAVYMATDYVTSPMSRAGMLVYGVGIGLLTMFIRLWGAYPEGMSFAILIMNATVPLINMYIKPRRFGAKTRRVAMK